MFLQTMKTNPLLLCYFNCKIPNKLQRGEKRQKGQPMSDDKNGREIPYNKVRKKMGLPPIRQKKTTCLSCQRIFTSTNYPANRVCKACKSNLTWHQNMGVFDCLHSTGRKNYKTPIDTVEDAFEEKEEEKS